MNLEQRKIKVPDLNSISHWPEKPYRWMIEGLVRTIEKVEGDDANYLVALGLVSYTEIMGHEVRKFKKLSYGSGNSKEAFDTFLGEYIGYKDLLKHPVYDWFRCGLCHEFKIKLTEGGQKSGPFHFFNGNENERKTIKNLLGADPALGIVVTSNGQRLLFIESYLNDFTKGVEKFLKESKQIIQ